MMLPMTNTIFGRALAAVSLGLVLTACTAPVGVGGAYSVPKDGAQQCADVCAQMGLDLSNVVVMASNVGCVCEPKGRGAADASKASASRGADASGGMAAILLTEEQRQAAQTHH